MDQVLRIHLFGGFLLEYGNEPIPPIPSRLARSLFAYLVANGERAHTRELLSGIFWRDLSESRARRRLSHTLWQIQSVLAEVSPETYITVTPNTVQFNRDASYWLDVEEFERSLSPARGTGRSHQRKLERAVSLYRGDFLAGFYDDWILVEQEQRRVEYFSALSRLVQVCKSMGEYEEALVYARRLTVADPLREDAHRDVMRLCSLLDRFSEAVQQYDRCAAILDEELGSRPSPETDELFRSILALREKGEQPFTLQVRGDLYGSEDAPLVGRAAERAALVERIEDVFAGHGGVVLIEGEPGIGKTRLLKELSNDANWRGLGVLWGSCPEDSRLPYEPVRQALAAGLSPLRAEQLSEIVEGVWLREVSRIVPEVADWLPELPDTVPLRAGEGAGRIREAVTRVITALGQINETLVVIDDIQWADDDTLQMLLPLAERLAESRVLLCLSYRSVEGRDQAETWNVLRRLDSLAATRRLQLGPLSAEETEELVRRSTGVAANPPELVSGLYQETGGNPFFMLEMMRALFEEKARLGESTSLLELLGAMDFTSLDEKVAEIIGRRITELGPGASDVLNAAAMHGGRATIGDLTRISDVPRSHVLEVLDGALTAKIMYESGGAYRFWHQIFRRYVADRIDPGEVVGYHRRAAELFEDDYPDDIEALAHHFSHAGIWPKAVRYLAAAGRRAVDLHAYETAARLYGQAVGRIEDAELGLDAEFEVMSAFERVLDVLGRRTEQEDVVERMLGLASDPARLAIAHRRHAWLLANTDRFDDAQAAARVSLVHAESIDDPGHRGAALTVLAMALSWSGQVSGAVPHLEAAVASYVDQPEQEADARAALGNVLTRLQRYDEGQTQLESAIKIYRDAGNRRGEAEALGFLATVYMEQGDPATAAEHKRRALEVCREIGYRHGEALSLVNLGNTCRHQGLIAEAMRSYRESQEVFASIGNSRGEAWARANAASLAHTYLGDDDRARRDARRALDYFEAIGHPQGCALCLDVLGGIARRVGDYGEARRHYEAAMQWLDALDSNWTKIWIRVSIALLELDEGNHVEALRHVGIAEEIVRRGGLSDAAVVLLAARGRALMTAGRLDEAFEATSEAYHGLREGVDQGYLVAYGHFQTAVARGDLATAREAIDRANSMLATALEGLDADELEHAYRVVPEHRTIYEKWSRYQPVSQAVRLPAADAPSGRPLTPDEFAEVVWTVLTYEDRAIVQTGRRRQAQIKRLLEEAREQGAAARVEDLAKVLDVSVATIRRDLRAIRNAGVAVTTRGSRRRAR